MTKDQIVLILKNIDVSKYPLKPGYRLVVRASNDAVRSSLLGPDESDENPDGLCGGYGFFEAAVPFESATKHDILVAAETALTGTLRHELHEHMRSEGDIVFNAHPEVPGYMDERNKAPL